MKIIIGLYGINKKCNIAKSLIFTQNIIYDFQDGNWPLNYMCNEMVYQFFFKKQAIWSISCTIR